MAYAKSTIRPTLPCPAGITASQAATVVTSKVAFFSRVFSKADVLAYPASVYSTIINSPDVYGVTLEQALGSVNAKMEMSSIMFQLTTGYAHTDSHLASTAKPARAK